MAFSEPMITTMLGTGIRIGELLGLKWKDINFEKKTISVNRTLVYVRNKLKNTVSKYNHSKPDTPSAPSPCLKV